MNKTSTETATGTALGDLIQARQISLGVSDAELAAMLGFKKDSVIKMMKSGRMQLPLTKAPELASALGLELWEVVRLAAHASVVDLIESFGAPGNNIAQPHRDRAA
ncbi:MAG: hypothetical protein JSS14_03420 [Proteobacteria bacterium]|nr:hypothetical protein [Pseudomonadota bacterium]